MNLVSCEEFNSIVNSFEIRNPACNYRGRLIIELYNSTHSFHFYLSVLGVWFPIIPRLKWEFKTNDCSSIEEFNSQYTLFESDTIEKDQTLCNFYRIWPIFEKGRFMGMPILIPFSTFCFNPLFLLLSLRLDVTGLKQNRLCDELFKIYNFDISKLDWEYLRVKDKKFPDSKKIKIKKNSIKISNTKIYFETKYNYIGNLDEMPVMRALLGIKLIEYISKVPVLGFEEMPSEKHQKYCKKLGIEGCPQIEVEYLKIAYRLLG